MSLIKSDKVWPTAIAVAILIFFSAIVYSISLILKEAPVQKSDAYMMGYNYADLKANEIIQAKIDFNKKYKISYETESLALEDSVIKYKITDLDGNPVNDANIIMVITRPEDHKHKQEFSTPSVENGIYSFSGFTLQKPGRWDIMAKITIGNNERFFNVKADTRAKEAFEY